MKRGKDVRLWKTRAIRKIRSSTSELSISVVVKIAAIRKKESEET